jgi:hypothetical protein
MNIASNSPAPSCGPCAANIPVARNYNRPLVARISPHSGGVTIQSMLDKPQQMDFLLATTIVSSLCCVEVNGEQLVRKTFLEHDGAAPRAEFAQ